MVDGSDEEEDSRSRSISNKKRAIQASITGNGSGKTPAVGITGFFHNDRKARPVAAATAQKVNGTNLHTAGEAGDTIDMSGMSKKQRKKLRKAATAATAAAAAATLDNSSPLAQEEQEIVLPSASSSILASTANPKQSTSVVPEPAPLDDRIGASNQEGSKDPETVQAAGDEQDVEGDDADAMDLSFLSTTASHQNGDGSLAESGQGKKKRKRKNKSKSNHMANGEDTGTTAASTTEGNGGVGANGGMLFGKSIFD